MTDFATPMRAIDEWVDNGIVRGASAVIWHGGGIAATRVAGIARGDEPVREDTLFALASVSKPITAAALLKAVDDGDLALDSPVAALVPELGEVDDPLDAEVVPQLEALREHVTVRQLLCHVAGLPENVGAKRVRTRDRPSLDQIVDAMCGLPLLSAPGETLRYSNPGFGIAGRVLERATGRQVHAYIEREILEPLGLTNVAVRSGTTQDHHIAHVDDASNGGSDVESYNSDYWRSTGIPWGGFFGSPTDLARFAASFFEGQASPLSAESRADMIVDQTGGAPGGVNSPGVHWQHGAWGLGWEVAADKRQHWTGTLRSPRTFCHWGQAGTLLWADPDRELVLAVFANRSVRQPWPLKPARWLQLSDAVVEAADSHS
jgi:CubicO group peptidase (beta-lactamase class C family)